MVLSKYSLVATAAVVLGVGLGGARATRAFDVHWLPTGTSSWNNVNNWSDTAGGAPRGAVPAATPWEEVGVINNGGTASLAAPITESTGGVALGQAATDAGTLAVTSGGVFTSISSPSTDGVVYVGVNGTGTLNISGTGSLSAPGLSVGGQPASAAHFSGNASITVNGTSTIGRNLRITGPNVIFSSSTGVTLQGNSVLTHEITSGAGHSSIRSAGGVQLGGQLNVQFSGVTPTLNGAWNLVDAAGISGNFANASVGSDIQVTGVSAPAVGSAYRLRQQAGGTNGQLLQVALETMLVLRVNRDTGEMSIRNPLGATVPSLAGYTITSPSIGSLLTAYKGISGAPAGDAGWEKAPMNSVSGLAEFKPTGSYNASSSATNLSLGVGFNKTAVASKGLGVNGEDLAFSYHAVGGGVVRGQVEYVGTPFLNNIALIVNTTTGQATLKNDTLQALSIDGYSIVSSTGALSGTGWTSLADRPGQYPNWQESPVTANAISETNPSAPMALSAGQSITLGTIGNFATAAAQNGLSLKFILGNEPTLRFGNVWFTSGTGPAGDFDGNGRVDGADFLAWQRGGSPSPLSAGDLATWKANFGTGASDAIAAAVPEPTTPLLAVAALAIVGLQQRRITARSNVT